MSTFIAAVFLFAAEAMTFTADKIAADNITQAMSATGHIVAVYGPATLRGNYLSKAADGTMLFADPTCFTTCSNEVGHTHWNVSGEVEYKAEDYVILRNAYLTFCEFPIFYLPYLYYPLGTDCGFSWMPGYTERWGAYLLTKTSYVLAGDPKKLPENPWLKGATRLDLRYENGIGLGEDLEWELGEFGQGKFKVYYAWDQDHDRWGGDSYWMYHDRSESITTSGLPDFERYGFDFEHRWDITERDTFYIRGTYDSDAFFRTDFVRQSFFTLKNEWLGREGDGVFWEHNENDYGFGAQVSGRLNKFYSGVSRLPEIYLDVNPQPIFSLPLNYESSSRIGYLARHPQEVGYLNRYSPYSYRPGYWAEYETFRFDTYHRITAPFRVFDDVLAVVPRLGYQGTFWNESGANARTGLEAAENAGQLFRSIGEAGVTFAARGTAMVDDEYRHLVEPYLDVLAQEAWYSGLGNDNRAYVFDSIDASSSWEDQFAGRSRNLPYSYYGVTPGVRNQWSKLDERGNFRQILDFDVYAAAQFNRTDYIYSPYYLGAQEFHRLAEPGKPNYGAHGGELVPGARLRWTPDRDISLLSRVEYDVDNNRIALGDFVWQQKVSDKFNYYVRYSMRDSRWWDFSSTGYRNDHRVHMTDHRYGNWTDFSLVSVGFTQVVCDWLQWSPYLRWDCRDGELDEVGGWVDYLTDCLGFRLQVAYENEYTLFDGYTKWGDEFHVGFFIYLRALGPESMDVFTK